MPSVDRSYIKVKAFAVVMDPAGTYHAVWRGDDPSKTPTAFHRPLGGGVELGERSDAAVAREISEELGATLIEPRLLGVLENIFEYDGMAGHEVAFVYAGRLGEPDVVPDQGREFVDNGEVSWVEWRPLDSAGVDLPLYPDGLQELIDTELLMRPPGAASAEGQWRRDA